MKDLMRLMRVKHYVKNGLIFVPLFFSQQLFNSEKFLLACIGFAAFSLISSAIYIVNDLQDIEKDRLHPMKRNRPLASGAVSKKTAIITAMICIIMSLFLNVIIFSVEGTLILLLYFILNVAYSMGLKNYPLLDVVILSSGFLLRVLYGANATSVVVSDWLCLTVISGAFYLSLGKRRNEIKKQGSSGETRSVLKYYTYSFLNNNMYVCLALTNMFYALWAIGKEDSLTIWTVPIVMLIFMKYSLNIEQDSDGDPTEVLLRDKMLILLCVVYLLAIVGLLYM